MSMKSRIQSEARAVSRVTNQDIVCRDCRFKYDDSIKWGNTSTCKKYKIKPNQVILGKACDKYEKGGKT